MGVSWNAKVAMLATLAMCMAFTVLVSSAYIFTLRILVEKAAAIEDEAPIVFTEDVSTTIDQQSDSNNTTTNISSNNNTNISNNSTGSLSSNNTRNISSNIDGNIHFSSSEITFDSEENLAVNQRNRSSRHRRSWLYGNNTQMNATERNLTEITEAKTWAEFRENWANSLTFVLTTSGLTFVAGLIQFFSSTYIILHARGSSIKFLRAATTRWMILSVLVVLILIICVTSNGAMQSDPESLFNISKQWNNLENNALVTRPGWLTYIISNIYNLIVLLDACGLFFLIGIGACLLNSHPTEELPSPAKSTQL